MAYTKSVAILWSVRIYLFVERLSRGLVSRTCSYCGPILFFCQDGLQWRMAFFLFDFSGETLTQESIAGVLTEVPPLISESDLHISQVQTSQPANQPQKTPSYLERPTWRAVCLPWWELRLARETRRQQRLYTALSLSSSKLSSVSCKG